MEKSARILIVDDDENIRKILQTILEDEGYITDAAETAKKSIEKSENEFYNLIQIDVRLPDMEGIDLLSKLRDTTPKMRKIIVSGYPTLLNAVGAINKGADAYVMKPFDVEKLIQTITSRSWMLSRNQSVASKGSNLLSLSSLFVFMFSPTASEMYES